MEIISRISKGSKMDQIYIPRNRYGMRVGSYVVIRPLVEQKEKQKPFLYNIHSLEPIKMKIIEDLFATIDNKLETYDNLIITGSFLDNGFSFHDIDLLIISSEKVNINTLKKDIEESLGIKADILLLDNKSLLAGLSTDPLYETMLSKCIAMKRIIYKRERRINYKILDLHLLKSEIVIENFDALTGREIYYYTRNMVAIFLFLQNKKITKELIDENIKKIFSLKEINPLKENIINKKSFLKRYEKLYKETFSKIMRTIKNGAKQE